MDDFMSSDEVLCYKDAVAYLKFSGRKPNSAIVYRTIRRFVEDQVGLYREEELLPACSNSSRESNYHDSQGEIYL